MIDGENKADDGENTPASRRDWGVSFIELLVAIVLLGTVVIAVLVALQVTTTASITDAEHARAFSLLHDASDSVFESDRMPCIAYNGGDASLPSSWSLTPKANLIQHYQDAVDATVEWPQGWNSGNASVQVTDVQFLYKDDLTDFTWTSDSNPNYCQEGVRPDGPDTGTDPDDYRDEPLYSQKVTIVVTAPDGTFTKLLETVVAE